MRGPGPLGVRGRGAWHRYETQPVSIRRCLVEVCSIGSVGVLGGTTRHRDEILICQCPRHRYEVLGLSVFEEAGPGTGERHRLGLLVSEKTGPAMVRSCD